MAFTVNSPHSGKPVKVREQDLGRALRDEGGRVFYALNTTDGNGVYGAVTRKGSPDEEARYANQQWRLPPEPLAAGANNSANDTDADATPHDATGPGRRAPVSRYIIIVVVIALLGAGGYAYYATMARGGKAGAGSVEPPALQAPAPTQTPADEAAPLPPSGADQPLTDGLTDG